jgi:hypothetical protein
VASAMVCRHPITPAKWLPVLRGKSEVAWSWWLSVLYCLKLVKWWAPRLLTCTCNPITWQRKQRESQLGCYYYWFCKSVERVVMLINVRRRI